MSYQSGFGKTTDMKCRSLKVGDFDVFNPEGNLCATKAKILGDLIVDGETVLGGKTSIMEATFFDLDVNGDLCVLGETKTGILHAGNATITLFGGDSDTTPVGPAGSLLYDPADETVFVSTGNIWTSVSAISALPPSLQSIADIVTMGNEYLYTTGPNTYTKGTITTLMRTLLAQSTQNSAQSILGVVPGVTVLPNSALLQSIADKEPLSAGDMIYATGAATTATTPSMAFGRSLLNTINAADARNALDVVTGMVDIPNRLVKVSGTDSLTQTGISVDVMNNMTGLNGLTLTGDVSMTGLLDGITEDERAQLRNIDTTTISSMQWDYLGGLDQALSSGSTPTFNGAAMSGAAVTGLADPVNNQDAATKAYVDIVAGTGAPPLAAVSFSTAAVLPNAPTYASPAETLTSTAGAGVALTVDGITLVVGDQGKRLLVKNQADDRENGIYVVTDYGGGASAWQLTRATDFNEAAMPLNAGSSVLVLIGEGGTHDGTTWSLQATVTQVDPLSDSVGWVQIGALQTFSAGPGIDALALAGGTIQTDISARLKYTGNDLDLNTVPTAYGGTGVAVMAGQTGRVLVTDGADGTNAMNVSKTAPAGDFVGTTDAQALTNKTITASTNVVRATQLGTTGADVVVSGAAPPSLGKVLVATSATTAAWLTPSAPDRFIRVAKSGGDYSSLGAALADIGVGIPAPVVPISPDASSNPVSILVAPGTYYETNPLIVPPYVSIVGVGLDNAAFIVPDTPNQPVFIVQAASALRNFTILNNGTNPPGDGTTPLAGIIGVQASFGAGDPCMLNKINVRRCSVCFESIGSGTNDTSIMIMRDCLAIADAAMPTITTTVGYRASNGGSMLGFSCIVASKGVGAFTTRGLEVLGSSALNRGSIAMYNLDCSLCLTALYVGNYGTLALTSATVRFFVLFGLDMYANANVTLMATTFMDHTAIFPTQIHFRTSGIGDLRGVSLVTRLDRVLLDANTRVTGFAVGLQQGEVQNQFLGEISVGFPSRGFESAFGEGDSHVYGLTVLQYDSMGASFVNITSNVKIEDGTSSPIFVNNVAGDILYVGIDTVNGPDTPFYGVKMVVPSGLGVSPAGGRSNSPTEPPSYHYVWEYYDGAVWRQFPILVSQADAPYRKSARDAFAAGAQQVNFPPLHNPYPILTTTVNGQVPISGLSATKPVTGEFWFNNANVSAWPAWAKTTVNGFTGYWIRIRQISALTSVPQLDLVKLHSSRSEFNADGFYQAFGQARSQVMAVDSSAFKEHSLNPSKPSSVDLFLADDITMEMMARRFSGTSNQAIAAVFRCPPNFDSSEAAMLCWRWVARDNTVANVRWTIRWGYSRNYNLALGSQPYNLIYDGAAAAPTTATTERSIVFETPTNGVANSQVETTCRMDFADSLPTDLLWVSFERTGSADAYNGVVDVVDITVCIITDRNGSYRN